MLVCDNSTVKILRKNQYQNHWLKQPMSSQQYRPWLIDKGSLTKALQRRYVDFAVKPVNLNYAKPLRDEVALLQQRPQQRALIREVLLIGNNQAVVFAHSVLPKDALRGAWNKLGRLGNKPLGATLFANPKVKRTPLEYKKLSRNHPLFKRTTAHIKQKPRFLWARRSVFSLYSASKLNTIKPKCASILVTEIFLPHILHG